MKLACQRLSHGLLPRTSRTTHTTGIRSRLAATAQASSTLVLRCRTSGRFLLSSVCAVRTAGGNVLRNLATERAPSRAWAE